MRFAPVLEADASVATCLPYPWAHVRLGARAQLLKAYGAMLHEIVAATAPDVRLPPPLPRFEQGPGAVFAIHGCLMCGVDAQTMPAAAVMRLGGVKAAAARVWVPKRIPAGSLGGRRGPESIVGHSCVACSTAVDHVEALGPSAMERALTEHLRATERGDEADRLAPGEVRGLIGWGALFYRAQRRAESAPAPSPNPWAHILVPPDRSPR